MNQDDDTLVDDNKTTWKKNMTTTKKNAKAQKNNNETNVPIPINLQKNPLENIHTPPPPPPSFSEEEEKVGKEGFTKKESGEMFKKLQTFIKPIIRFLNNTITKPTIYLDKAETWVAIELANIFSTTNKETKRKDTNKKDILLIKQEFQSFITVVLCCYMVYNWYFLVFHKEPNKEPFNISTSTLKQYSSIASLFFKYTIVPLSFLNSVCVYYLPGFVNFFTNSYLGEKKDDGTKETKHGKKLNFIILFFFIVLLTTYLGPVLQKNLINGINMRPDSYSNAYIASFFLFGVASVFMMEVNNFPFNIIGFYLHKVQLAYLTIPTLLLFVLRMMWSMSIVWLSGLLVVLYIFLYSFFAIFMHSNISIFKMIEKMHKSIIEKTEKKHMNEQTGPCGNMHDPFSPCNTDNLFVKLYYILEKTIDFCVHYFYVYLFEITFIVVFLKSIIDYELKIKDANLKTSMVIMCCVFIFMCCFFIVFRQLGKNNEYYKLLKSSTTNPFSNTTTTTLEKTIAAIPAITPATPITTAIPSTTPTAIPSTPTPTPAIPTTQSKFVDLVYQNFFKNFSTPSTP